MIIIFSRSLILRWRGTEYGDIGTHQKSKVLWQTPRPYSARTSPSLPPLSRVFCLSEVMSRLKITRSAIAGGPTAWPDSKYIASHVFYIHRQVFESNHSLHYDSYMSQMNETLKWLEYDDHRSPHRSSFHWYFFTSQIHDVHCGWY